MMTRTAPEEVGIVSPESGERYSKRVLDFAVPVNAEKNHWEFVQQISFVDPGPSGSDAAIMGYQRLVEGLTKRGINVGYCAACGSTGGEFGMIHHFIVRNRVTGEVAAVGSECIERVLTLSLATKIKALSERARREWTNRVRSEAWVPLLETYLTDLEREGLAGIYLGYIEQVPDGSEFRGPEITVREIEQGLYERKVSSHHFRPGDLVSDGAERRIAEGINDEIQRLADAVQGLRAAGFSVEIPSAMAEYVGEKEGRVVVLRRFDPVKAGWLERVYRPELRCHTPAEFLSHVIWCAKNPHMITLSKKATEMKATMERGFIVDLDFRTATPTRFRVVLPAVPTLAEIGLTPAKIADQGRAVRAALLKEVGKPAVDLDLDQLLVEMQVEEETSDGSQDHL